MKYVFLFSILAGVSGRAQSFALAHVTVIDVVNGSLQQDMTVAIRGDRIASVTRSSHKVAASRRAGVINAHGLYLIPGLWDMHTHVYFDNTADAGTDLILPLFLLNGVTGVRDMGSQLDQVLHARQAIRDHTMIGPRMVVSGPMLDGPTTPYKAAIAIRTPEDGRDAVDMLKARGVDFIKVQSYVPRDAYFAIADEAKRQGLMLEGHVPDAIRATEAIARNQRTFEHLIGIFEGSSPDENIYLTGKKSPGAFLRTYDPTREAKLISLLAQHQVWQCPTLYWERGQWLVDAIDYTLDPDLEFAGDSWVKKRWPATRKAIVATMDTDPLSIREAFVEHELGIVRRLHAAGVPFLAGTDTPAGVDVLPGFSLHLELQRLVAAGFTPLEALQTATINPARFLKRSDDLGTVQAGHLADLVLLDANPLVSITNTRRIVGIVADGHYLSRAKLDALRVKLKQVAAKK